ncbi:MAG: family 16 glycosylhydrolase [Actinomycetota bacterium]|nr:family 16 glycosylhydrolase [Actinomycetota bacterium]
MPSRFVSFAAVTAVSLGMAGMSTAAATAAGAGSTATAPVADSVGTAAVGANAINWQRVYRHNFTDMKSVVAFQTGSTVNGQIRPDDNTTQELQKPVVKSLVSIVTDSSAEDGKALSVNTRKTNFQTPTGTRYGWANGRMMLYGHNQAPPVKIKARIKMTPSVMVKSAVMWWPASGGWKWEVDFAETFGGDSLTSYWGSRKHVSQRWHADLNGDGQAREQLIKNLWVNAAKWHVYELTITPTKMSVAIDGVERYATTDQRFIPKDAGFFSIGKALSHVRSDPSRTNDSVYVDYVEFSRPAA